MYDETARDSFKDGTKFCDQLRKIGIVAGIKVDKGVIPLAGTYNETVTIGLDGLEKRCAEYYAMGCRFAKWRATIRIGNGLPSELSIKETAHSLARYG
jgi:fructose-bisphosphate aldolase class I